MYLPLNDTANWSHEKRSVAFGISNLVMEGTINFKYFGRLGIKSCTCGHYEDCLKYSKNAQENKDVF